MHEKRYTKVWKREHMAEVPEHLPEVVQKEILDIIETLNRYYGEHRDVDRDLGGYLAVFPEAYQQKDYEALLKQYHLRQADREYWKAVYQDGPIRWIEEVFLCGSDYSLVMIRPE